MRRSYEMSPVTLALAASTLQSDRKGALANATLKTGRSLINWQPR